MPSCQSSVVMGALALAAVESGVESCAAHDAQADGYKSTPKEPRQ